MVSDVAVALIAAGGAVAGGAVTGVITLRATLPYRQQAALQRQAALVAARVESYSKVIAWMSPYLDDQGAPREVPLEERQHHVHQLREWYYNEGGALLLTGNSFNAYRSARAALLDTDADSKSVADALSALRTELKLDVGSRQPQERDKPFARSIERDW